MEKLDKLKYVTVSVDGMSYYTCAMEQEQFMNNNDRHIAQEQQAKLLHDKILKEVEKEVEKSKEEVNKDKI